MNTRLIKIDKNNINCELLKEPALILKNGGIVAFPTETVYGLGASAYNEHAAAKVYEAKGRPSDNPMIVHIYDKSQLDDICTVPETAIKLGNAFWPGPLTMILKKKDAIPSRVTGGLDSVGVRMPNHKVALMLLQLCGVPVAAPSANISGRPSPTEAAHVISDLNGKVDAIIDGGMCDVGIESTVIDLTGEIPVILRPGGITLEDIAGILPDAKYADHLLDKLPEGTVPKSPGMKYKHYAPKASVIVIEGDINNVRKEITARICSDRETGFKPAVLALEGAEYDAETVEFKDALELANVLFSALRNFDSMGIDRVYCEPVKGDGMAVSVKNRLYKSAGYNIVRV